MAANADGFIPTSAVSLAFGRQSARGVDPTIWDVLLGNAVATFGQTDTKVARRFYNKARQRGKANLVQRISNASLSVDLTKNEIQPLLQSLFFGVVRQKGATQPINGTQIAISAVDGTNDQYETAGDFTVAPNRFRAGDLVLASGFGVAANNGLKTLDAVAATAVDTVEDLTAEASPPAAAKLEVVGFQFASGDATLTNSGSAFPVLGATAKDLTELGLTVGEWIRIGGDIAASQFATAADNCYAQVHSITATAITLRKTTSTIVTDAGVGKTIQIFLPRLYRNETDETLILQILFQLERTLGRDADGVMSQYVTDCIMAKAVTTIEKAAKATVDMDFLGSLAPIRAGSVGVKSGTRRTLTPDDFINSSTNILRSKLAVISTTNANPSALARFAEKIEITYDNNPAPVEAVGTLGAVGVVPDDVGVDIRIDGLFDRTDIQAASQANTELTYDLIVYQSLGGIVYDGPLCTVNTPTIETELGPNPIREPLELAFADSTSTGIGNTFSESHFPYLPAAAGTI